MSSKTTAISLILLALVFSGCDNSAQKTRSAKPAIVMVAFGTSKPQARKVFDYIDSKVIERYSEYDVRWAFTSEFIARKLKKQGIVTKNPQEVIADLKKEGFKSAVFQSLHVSPGQEFNEIAAVDASGLEIAVGKALLSSDADIEAVVKALDKDIKTGSANIIAAHGNRRHPEFNKQLLAFAKKVEPQYSNVFVCSVEGQPGTDKMKKASLLAKKTGSANFIPLMIVAGDHIMNDVVGDEADSWKNIVGAKQNFRARPLGYNDKVIDIYLEHLNSALKSIEN
jgi:sirohydrochlorin cobaltochelatase